MPTHEQLRSIVVDANVLIDYRESDLGVLRLVSQRLGRIIVPDIVLEEVEDVDESTALAHGITVVETPLDTLGTTSGGSMSLSLPDRALPRQRAVAIGKAMHAANPRSITDEVLSDFLEKL